MVRYSNEHNWFSLTPVGMTYELKYRHQSTGARNQSWKPARVTWALVIAGDWLFQSETPPTYSLQDNTVHYSLEKKSEIPRKSADTMAGIVMKMIFICCFQSFCIFSKGVREGWKVDFRGASGRTKNVQTRYRSPWCPYYKLLIFTLSITTTTHYHYH